MEAETRAFASLSAHDQEELVRLVGAYAEAIDREIDALREKRKEETENGNDESR